jgi:hypothetical protein
MSSTLLVPSYRECALRAQSECIRIPGALPGDEAMSRERYGVGLLAAGPVAQAIHAPTVRRLDKRVSVAHVADMRPEAAESVASSVGARWSTTARDFIEDPDVDIVVVGGGWAGFRVNPLTLCVLGPSRKRPLVLR